MFHSVSLFSQAPLCTGPVLYRASCKIWSEDESLRRRKNTQKSEDERLDKRIKSARARHILAHPVMGTIFLVILFSCLAWGVWHAKTGACRTNTHSPSCGQG